MVYSLSHVRLFSTPWTVAHQPPLSMGFPRQAYWSGLPFPSPGDLPDSVMESASPASAGRFFTTEPPGKPANMWYFILNISLLHSNKRAYLTRCSLSSFSCSWKRTHDSDFRTQQERLNINPFWKVSLSMSALLISQQLLLRTKRRCVLVT